MAKQTYYDIPITDSWLAGGYNTELGRNELTWVRLEGVDAAVLVETREIDTAPDIEIGHTVRFSDGGTFTYHVVDIHYYNGRRLVAINSPDQNSSEPPYYVYEDTLELVEVTP
jgi:hypothetical protein